jgi:hypothetical protein
MSEKAHINSVIIIPLITIFIVLGVCLYLALDCKMKVNIIRNPEKTLSTMPVEKARIIDFRHNKDRGTYIEFQIDGTEIIGRKTFMLKYDDIKINDEINVIFNKKVFGDYIIIEGIKSYEYEKKYCFFMFFYF